MNEWKAPGKKTIVKCAVNQRQVVIALTGGELVYFEMDPVCVHDFLPPLYFLLHCRVTRVASIVLPAMAFTRRDVRRAESISLFILLGWLLAGRSG